MTATEMQLLLKKIADALGTAEAGDDLAEVAAAAHRAEQALARRETELDRLRVELADARAYSEAREYLVRHNGQWDVCATILHESPSEAPCLWWRLRDDTMVCPVGEEDRVAPLPEDHA